MIISALLLLLVSNGTAQEKVLGEAGDAPLYAYPYQLPSAFCAKHELTCVLDMTSTRSRCDFSSSVRKELDKVSMSAGRRLLEKQCRGYQWRVSEGIHLFEPRSEKESQLTRKVGAQDSGGKIAPTRFIFELASTAGLKQAPGYGLGAKSRGKPPIRFKTPPGTLKAALISAAKQYPGTVWAIVQINDGYVFISE